MQRSAGQSPHDLLREFAGLNRRRKADGVTPLEYQRWLDLGRRLEAAFPDRPALGRNGTVCLLVDFANEKELAASVMMNVRPVGLFVNTPFPPDRGTHLELRVRVQDSGEVYASRVTVVSNNVGPDFSTQALGMGLKFRDKRCELRSRLDALCGIAVEPEDESEAADG